MVGRLTTCIQCRKSFRPSIYVYHGMSTCSNKLRSFQECPKNIMLNIRCPGRGEKAPFESTWFLDIHRITPIFFIGLNYQFKAPSQVALLFDIFCIFWSFLHLKRSTNGRTYRNLHTMSEVIQISHK